MADALYFNDPSGHIEGAIQTREWGRIANMADPFGNGFCLIEFIGRGYDEIV
jgi:predicted enzyme related to lactoylglutathione lyase